MDALRARGDHGVRWRTAPPGDLRRGRSIVTDEPTGARPTARGAATPLAGAVGRGGRGAARHGPDRRHGLDAVRRLGGRAPASGPGRLLARALTDPDDRRRAGAGGGPRRGRGHPHGQRRGPRRVRRGADPARRCSTRRSRCPRWCWPTSRRASRTRRSRPCASGARSCCSGHATCGATTRTPIRRTPGSWSELAPDEARILLLLLRGGPQPSVDVRTGGPVGLVSSALVAPGMSMIGARAGCRYLDEVPAYLNNLFRLGLIWFSREQLEDPMEYQVVEAQPDVLEAMHSVRFPKVVRRSHPPHAVRRRLLQGLPGRPGGDRRAAGSPDPRGVDRRIVPGTS